MVIRIKLIDSSSEGGGAPLTEDNVYLVLGISDTHWVIVDDNGAPYITVGDVTHVNRWIIDSITDTGSVQIFP